ncbi:polysaccharide deacetylase family protein [Psychrobacter sp. DAB_AL62B]|uniref:polysaccharide deacetylase family protein n=1 Tax=Psychrobacter sp. DAB_AL62B TaxID=1028420 RepID=UPI0023815B8C|nr:polysaccharide deacetylase family protein [Psychrobacter sp. DAB_AL62B]MDE4455113.1 hypothetical protein [Psychrobacter sp. DAB_AL62B]
MGNELFKKIIFSILAKRTRLESRKEILVKNNIITVLNLHRVSPDTGSAYKAISPIFFDKVISYLTKEFHICLFSDFEEIKTNKPKLILSFDDGYKDFIDYAVPILEKYNVRVNQNVIPYCIETGLPPINVLLQDFIGKAPTELLKKIPLEIDATIIDRYKLGTKASFIIKYLPEVEFISCRAELLEFLLNYPEFLCASVMTKKDVMQLSSIHEIGAHSFEHLSMENQSEEYFLTDLKKCKEYFLESLFLDCNIYCFPNGSALAEQIVLAKKYGFQNVLLVGNKYSNATSGIFHRFTFDVSSMNEAKYKSFGRRALLI